ncbi:hypothetical protein [Nocardiopsis coralliicola]
MSDLSRVRELAESQHGVVSRDQARSLGVSQGAIDRCLRSRGWTRIRPAIYHVREGPPPLAARAKALQLFYGPRAVAVGPTAARLWGLQGQIAGSAAEDVHLALSGRTSTAAGLRLHNWDIPPGEIAVRRGIRLSSPGRTLRDTGVLGDRFSAVSTIDSALHQGLVAAEDLPALLAANTGRPGSRRTRAWWDEADGRAESTFETRLRLLCRDHGVAPEELQYPVYGPGGTLAGRADLAWPSWGVVAEADGAGPHALPAALFADRGRQNRIAAGSQRLTLLRFTWSDLGHPHQIADLVRSARDARHHSSLSGAARPTLPDFTYGSSP